MQTFVIPDIHLKSWMFQKTEEIIQKEKPDKIVCLMDIPDDWQCQFALDLYEEAFDAAISFAKNHPETLWCWGNHDLCYMWGFTETGHSHVAASIVRRKLAELQNTLLDSSHIKYVHRIENTVFSHGGLSQYFVEKYIPDEMQTDIDVTLDRLNGLKAREMWTDASPIWFRPQYGAEVWRPDVIQVVGHTPMRKITKHGNVISCDVFSTQSDHTPFGTEEFLLVNTETGEFRGIPSGIQ